MLILYDSLKKKKLEDKIYKLSYKDLSSLFGVSKESVKYHFFKAREESKGAIQNKRRPFSLNETQLQKLNKWVMKHPFHPKLFTVRLYIEVKFDQYLSYNSLLKIFNKANLKNAMDDPMDESRYYCNQKILVSLSVYQLGNHIKRKYLLATIITLAFNVEHQLSIFIAMKNPCFLLMK